MEDLIDDPTATTVFTVLQQNLELDFSFCPRQIKGKTTINIQPQSQKLREIQLHCRQLRVTKVSVAGRDASFDYNNLYDRLSLYPGTGLEQYHFPQNRLQRHEEHEVRELVIFVPDKTRIKEVRTAGAQDTSFESLDVVIEYVLDDFRDAVYFAGVEDGDSRYPHAYTRNSPFPGTASTLFPCIDDGKTRGTFEVAVRYPRTVGDALCKMPGAVTAAQAVDFHKADSVMSESDDDHNDLTEEEKALEMSVICSGLLTDEVCSDSWRGDGEINLLMNPDCRPQRPHTHDSQLRDRILHRHSAPASRHCHRPLPARRPFRVP
jgi:transcription initiation factor TFIID subunit 2